MYICLYKMKEYHTRADTDCVILSSLPDAYAHYGIFCTVPAKVVRDERGKPHLDPSFLSVSVTHSGGKLAVAYDKGNFGIDMEREGRPVANYKKIAAKYFSLAEREYMSSGNGALRFLEIWVKKEAYLKYTGEGMSALSRADTTLAEGYFTRFGIPGFIAYSYSDADVGDVIINEKETLL